MLLNTLYTGLPAAVWGRGAAGPAGGLEGGHYRRPAVPGFLLCCHEGAQHLHPKQALQGWSVTIFS